MDWLGRTYRSSMGWNHVVDLVDLDGRRFPGTESERRAAELTRDRFAEAGARNARLEEFEIQGWRRLSSELTHVGTGTEGVCVALQRSPGGTVEGDLVDLGHGVPEAFAGTDVSGKVVMIATGTPEGYGRWVPRIESYLRAVEGGAVGFVVRNHQDGDVIRSGNVRGRDGDPIGDIPAVGVSFETGVRFARRFEGEPVRLSADVETFDATSQNVHAELGPDTDERIVVSSHVDSVDISTDGAMDDAVGVGATVEVANALAEVEDDLETRVEFVGFGAEVAGVEGSTYYAERTDRENVKVILQNDGIARGPNLRVYTHGFPELESLAVRTAERFREPITTTDDVDVSSDTWPFAQHGVPALLLASERLDGSSMYGITSRHVFTSLDTLDKLDSRDLRRQVVWEAALVRELADRSVDIEHRTREEVDEQLAATNRDFEDWVFPVV